MAGQLPPNTEVRRNKDGTVRQLRHVRQPYKLPDARAAPPQVLASRYVQDAADAYGLDPPVLANLNVSPAGELVKGEGPQLRLDGEKAVMNTRVVSYVQTVIGLPVWEAGLTVVMEDEPRQVVSSTSTFHHDVKVRPPGARDPFVPENEEVLRKHGNELLRKSKAKLVSMTAARLLIYRYDPDRRVSPFPEYDRRGDDVRGPSWTPSLLPPVDKRIEAAKHYVVTDLLFTVAIGRWPRLSMRAFIEVKTGSVLFLRPGVAAVNGMVFPYDPVIQSGNAALTPCSSNGELNPWRASVALQGLDAPTSGDQELAGEYVVLGEHADPAIAPPTKPVGTDFDYDARTDDFAAVNAYYHVDEAFRMVTDLGFSTAALFDGTDFPVTVDHRDGSKGTVQALGYGNDTQTGSGGFGFNLASADCTDAVGIASDFRVVWHEFCHALLWDAVHSPNFGFCHSAGDSLGVILSDWATQSPDRGLTFPFVGAIDRRHDRDVSVGWAWGGSHDDGGYESEQVLSSTLFRFYRSIGGDSSNEVHRELAARHTAFLIIGAIGTLTPTNNASGPDDYATALMDFDETNDFDGVSRGALHKVVRWAFEQQGLYQPSGAPTPVTSPGDPPDVDVYIDDGRAGTYEYVYNFWKSQDMWNRLAADGGTTHQTPILDVTNYMYVRVKNRGTQTASNVSVKAYHCIPGTGLVWPDDWQAMSPTTLSASSSIPSGAHAIVGPFEWTPAVEGHECLLAIASATDDPGNDTTVTGSIAHSRFVPFDNNVGQRNVAPVPGGGGLTALVKSFDMRRFWFKNPFERTVKGQLKVVMPKFLEKLGWNLEFLNPGGDRFTLGPRASREIVMRLREGGDFSPEVVRTAGRDRFIEVLSYVDGLLVGGMSYEVDPALESPAPEHPTAPPDAKCTGPARKLLDCLGLPHDGVKSVRVKRVTVDVDLKSKDC